MSRTVRERATISLSHVTRLRRHLARGSMDDELVFDAVAMRLSAAIEELSAIDEQILLGLFGDDWFRMKGTRNAIAHNYSFIDQPLLAETVSEHLDQFERSLRSATSRG